MKKHLTLTVDCAHTPTPALVHAHIARVLHFPPYYGANQDALRDCLTDVLVEHTVHLVWHDTDESPKSPRLTLIHKLLRELCVSQ